MKVLRRIVVCLLLAIAFFFVSETWRTWEDAVRDRATLEGIVIADGEPVVGAVVRLKGTKASATSDDDGRFLLIGHDSNNVVTASKAGFLIGSSDSHDASHVIELERLPAHDNQNYQWVDPHPDLSAEGNCANCHQEIYEQWRSGGHANSATNRRFMNLYEGTDWTGKQHASWSLADEHPLGLDVCASCHAPSHEINVDAGADMRTITGTSRHGVHCDFCHKVQDVVAGSPGLTHGRFGLKLMRPEEGQLFFGPLDDVDRGEDAFASIYQESRYCASCHEGVVFGVPVYTTYTEWLASPAKAAGKSCQSCHMERGAETMTNIAPGSGGIERDPQTLATHTLLPGGREAMLRRCLTMKVEAEVDETLLHCDVELLAHDVGHRVPTGFIDRHLILLVTATNAEGDDVALVRGQRLPKFVGSEAGKAGSLFAKLLADKANNPVPFWRSEREVVDTRLRPNVPVRLRFSFSATTQHVRVRLLYRRFWNEVVLEKGWPDDTIQVLDRKISVPDD